MPEDARESWLTRTGASACALALCAALTLAYRQQIIGVVGGDPVLLLMAGAFAILPWLPAQRRLDGVLAASLLIALWILRGLLAIPLGFTWLALRVSRSPLRTSAKLGLLLGAWLVIAVLGWLAMPHLPRYLTLAIYWGSLPPAVIWVVVEQQRGLLDGYSERAKWLYFLALPRFCTPFIQPLGATRLLRTWKPTPSSWLSLKGLVLGLYAIAVFYTLNHTHFSAKSSSEDFSIAEHGMRVVKNAVHIYSYNCGSIFLAVALFRLAGFDLGSGFNWPTLASSPSEFFRRWNYYFFDFANTMIFGPIVARLRRVAPVWIAYVMGGYASFALGVWFLDIVNRFPATYLGRETLEALTNVIDLRVHFAFWSVVIAAQVLLMPGRRFRRRWWWRVFGHVGTWALAIGGLIWLFVTKNRLY